VKGVSLGTVGVREGPSPARNDFPRPLRVRGDSGCERWIDARGVGLANARDKGRQRATSGSHDSAGGLANAKDCGADAQDDSG